MIEKIISKATAHTVTTFSRADGIFKITTFRYQVKGVAKGGKEHVVNVSDQSCTCGKWAAFHMPCSHVVAGCMHNNLNRKQWIGPYHYNSKLQEMWRPIIYPLKPMECWNYELPQDWMAYGNMVPDENLRKVRRKRGEKGLSVRIRTEMDASQSGKKCSVYKEEGHTKRSKKCPARQNQG